MKDGTPKRVSLLSLALLISLAERGGIILSNIMEGPRLSMNKGLNRIYAQKTLWEWYELLKQTGENSARTILWRLTKKGLVEKKGKRYFLSKLGRKFLKKQTQLVHEWDGKWRLVAFDIPEKLKPNRDWLRSQLCAADYRRLQKSLFVGKNPIKRELMEEILERDLYPYIRIMTMGEIDNETFFENL